MTASEAYEKYKHMERVLAAHYDPYIRDLWSAVKHEAIGQITVTDVLMDGESILGGGK